MLLEKFCGEDFYKDFPAQNLGFSHIGKKNIPPTHCKKRAGGILVAEGGFFPADSENKTHCAKEYRNSEHKQKEDLALPNNFFPSEFRESDGEQKVKEHEVPTGPDFFGPDQLDPCIEIPSHFWTSFS